MQRYTLAQIQEAPILLVGFGSIGRRHFRNLRQLGMKNLWVYRTGKSTLPDEELAGCSIFYDYDEALRQQPLAVIIANPTAFHLPFALKAAQAGCHLFIEKPISHTLDQMDQLVAAVRQQDLVVMVGFQFRWHPGLRMVKTWLREGILGPVASVHVRWGEYLPDWHPWEDYRQSYSARPELGGGVLLTLCHPFDYLRWLLGEVEAVQAMIGTRGGLGIDVEDVAQVTLRFVSGAIGSVGLDYVSRPTQHGMTIVGQRGTITWQQEDGSASLYSADKAERKLFMPSPGFNRNCMFVDELRNFLFCLANQAGSPCSLKDGIMALEIVRLAKQAGIAKKELRVHDVEYL